MFLQLTDDVWIQAARIHQVEFRGERVYLTFTDGATDWWNLTESDDPARLAEARAALLARIAAVPVSAPDGAAGPRALGEG
jgi:hypothetical protein